MQEHADYVEAHTREKPPKHPREEEDKPLVVWGDDESEEGNKEDSLAKFRRTCLRVFLRFVKNMFFATKWVADKAPDAKLPPFCKEFRPESNGTTSGP